MATDPQRAQANQPPALQLDGPLSYTENEPATPISPTARFSDSDTVSFNSAALIVTITANRTAADQLGIRSEAPGPGKIHVSGGQIFYGSDLIGYYWGSGANGTDLSVGLAEKATPEAVQALIRSTTYRNSSDTPSTASRTIEFIIADGGNTDREARASTTVNVAADDSDYNRIVGTSWDDWLYVIGGGADELVGLAGNDRYFINSSDDRVVEQQGEGRDRVYTITDYVLPANVEELLADPDRAASIASGLRLTGNALANTIYGSHRDDVINGAAGADFMSGGRGNDLYFVDDPADYVSDFDPDIGNAGIDTIVTSVSFHAGQQGMLVERIQAADIYGTAPLSLIGNHLDNHLWGTHGDNVLNGAGGADFMAGYAGNDLYYVDHRDDVAYEERNGGTDMVATTVSYTLGANVENLQANDIGGTAPLRLTGNALSNNIYGTQGDNVLNGAGGADFMAGYAGHDLYYVDHANDIAYEDSNGGIDTVATRVDYRLGANIENLQANDIGGTDPLRLTGNALANNIWGTQGNNVLNGAGGADFMAGYAGNDLYYVDHWDDLAYEDSNGGTDTVSAKVDYRLPANVENLQANDIYGTDPLSLTGNALANFIWGTHGDNLIAGRGGIDQLYGYGGSDRFLFNTAPGRDNYDFLGDFQAGVDKILLDNSVYSALADGALAPGAFRAGAAAADADDRIIFNPQNGGVFFDPDGSGAGAAVLLAIVPLGQMLTSNDFLVI